jgi:5'-deoxynucleotidase YfbR-like HD superfamily hydrolase
MSKLDEIQKFFYNSYTLQHTKRYSMKPVLHPESVATHSYFVALAVLLLRDVWMFDTNTAIKVALCHDLTEMEISDVNHYVKKRHPVIAKALKDAEDEVVRTFPEHIQPYCKMYDHESPESLVVHYADALQCYQYALNEMNLGNTGYMEEVFINSKLRMDAIAAKLEPWRINHENN